MTLHTGEKTVTIALLIQTSIDPNDITIASEACKTAFASATSRAIVIAVPPPLSTSRLTSFSASASRAIDTTFADSKLTAYSCIIYIFLTLFYSLAGDRKPLVVGLFSLSVATSEITGAFVRNAWPAAEPLPAGI